MISFKLDTVQEHFSEVLRITSWFDGQPYFGKSGSNRFDDPKGEYGVCYAAQDIRCAIAETLLHDEVAEKGFFTVEHEEISKLWVHHLQSKEPVHRVDFSGHLLKRLGVESASIMSETTLEHSQYWSREIYEHDDAIDCIQYVSRQNNELKGLALFERAVERRGVESVDCIRLAKYPKIDAVLDALKVRIV